MKKFITLFITIWVLFSLVACRPSQSFEAVETNESIHAPLQTETPHLYISQSAATLSTGESIQLFVNGASNITWSSSDPYIAQVDNNGLVTGRHKGGTVTITALANGQSLTFEITNKVIMRDISSSEIVAEMKAGMNFASALDYIDWDRKIGYDFSATGNQKIEQYKANVNWVPVDKVAAVFKEAGYNAIRLPISYTYFTNNDTFEIDEEWLDLIEATVNDFLDQDMYVIIEPHYDYLQYSWVVDHWDGMWMLDENDAYVNARFKAIWQQVAERFAEYDDYVLFETANEPTINNEEFENYFGNQDNRDSFLLDKTNELNEIFLSSIRASGGNNPIRHVVLVLPEIGSTRFLSGFEIPKDEDRIIVSIHYYYHLEDWSDFDTWSSENPKDTLQVRNEFSTAKSFMEKTGIPIILGEWGNTESLSIEYRVDQVSYIVQTATDLGIPGFWWECTHYPTEPPGERFRLYDRYENKWVWPEIKDAIMAIVYAE